MRLNIITTAINRLLDVLDSVIIILLGLVVFCVVMSIISLKLKWEKKILVLMLLCLAFFAGLTILAAYYQHEIQYKFIHESYYQNSDGETNAMPEHNESPDESADVEADLGELIGTETLYIDENNLIMVSVYEKDNLIRDYSVFGYFDGTDLACESAIFTYLMFRLLINPELQSQ